jgi:O-antigen/teichoic acid export membrane protein
VSRLSRNIIYNGLGQGLSVLLSFVAVRFVFRRLGGDALGLIYFSVAFSAALSVAVQLGICESAVREVASHHRNRPEYIERLIRTSSLLYWSGFLVLSIVAYAAAPYLVYHWVKLESLDALTAIKIMRILTLGALVALPGGLYRALLVGLQHMGVTNLIDVGGKALQQAGIFLILLIHGSLFHVAYWIAFSTLAPILVYWAACTHFFSARALLLPGFSLDVVKENIGYASGLMTITLCGWVLGQADKLIISKLLPLTLLGIYTFARGGINQGMLLTSAINGAIFPHFSALHGAGMMEKMKYEYNRIQDLICLGTIPVFAAVPFAAIPLFSRVFDMPSARLLLLPSTFLCVGYYMNGALTAPYVVSLAVGRPDISARQSVMALFVVVPASVIAIYFYGLNGAGFSWVIYHIFAYAYGLPRICRECLGMPARTWYGHFLRIFGAGLLIYGAAWMTLALMGAFSLVHLTFAYIVATLLYGALALQMMGDDARRTLQGFYSKWVKHAEPTPDSGKSFEEGNLPGGA